jgi:hypothetical protein
MQMRNGMLLGWKSQSGDGTMYSRVHVEAAYLTHWFCSCNFGICPAGSGGPQTQAIGPLSRKSRSTGKAAVFVLQEAGHAGMDLAK